MLEFIIDPPILTPWLSYEERDKNIVLLDMQADINKSQEIRFDLDIAFNPISIRRGIITINRKDFFIGCTGAEIFFGINDGKIIKFTEASILNVEYKNISEYTRNTALNLNSETKASIKYEKSKKMFFIANFNSEERTLAPIHYGNSIRWDISLPKGEKTIRDFLIGNLYLQATCFCEKEKISGNIKVKPSDITFFGPDKRPLNRKKSIIMNYFLLKNNIKINNRDGIETKFNQVSCEN